MPLLPFLSFFLILSPPVKIPRTASQPTLTRVIHAQILLSRANFSTGEIDGAAGANFRQAVKGFQTAHDLRVTGHVDRATWTALNADQAPALISYTITNKDTAGPFEKIPDDLMEQAKLPAMGYESVDAELGERFHSNPALLHRLNPNKHFDQPDTEIWVPDVDSPAPGKAASVTVSKSENTVTALDEAGKIIAQYPCTSGSDHDPLPIGEWKVKDIVDNPPFYYNPDLFWNADDATQAKAKIAPGPRGPVGVVWIGITKEHYGLHGTPAPALVGHAQSHGCVRLTNWDALQLSKMVAWGTPVYFKE
jgi:lipoprotein-anchoring transpeptidase ErfK/SrfK